MNVENIPYTDQGIAPLLFDASLAQDISFPREFLPLIKDKDSALYDQSKKLVGMFVRYKELMMMYNCALKEIRTRFEILNSEFNIKNKRNPIKFINTRLKCSASIIDKMKRNGIPLSIENIEDNINDVAGIRVICSYIDDIYMIANTLVNQDDVKPLQLKDYIITPKENGYRSLHLIVKIPINFENSIKHVKVEVQIRTLAMDFWATLEHELMYKDQLVDNSEITSELKECADIITRADSKMLDIRKKAEENGCDISEEEELLAQMRKFDHPV